MVGLYTSQVLAIDDAGAATHEWEFFDLATMMAQMQPDPKAPPRRAVVDKLAMPLEVVIAKDDDKEKANLAAVKKAQEAFSAHDAKAFGELLPDDAVWSEQAQPKDWTKKETLEHAQVFWKGFSDLKLHADQQWAAGDYVLLVGALDGTNDGDVPPAHLTKTGKKVHLPFFAIHKVEGGKLKATWLFGQSMAFATQLGLMPAPGSGSAAPTK
jgi:ketosteroid isomerase-like protein